MTSPDDRRQPEQPRLEPEIIPPDRGGGTRARPDVFVWVADGEGMRRTTVTLPGPLTIFLVLALIALVAGVVLIVVLGAVLIWIPIVILMFGALLLAAAARQYWERLRRWASRR